MKPWLLPSGLQHGIPFIMADDWTPEQAQAVIELLDDLREVLWSRYQLQLQTLLREQRANQDDSDFSDSIETDPPF